MANIPPNDINKIIPWLRLFAPDIVKRIEKLESKVVLLTKAIEKLNMVKSDE